MKERLVTLLLAVLSLYFFYTLFLGSPGRADGETVRRPTTLERSGNGYYALQEWLQRSGVPTQSWRDRYSKLPQQGSGSLLIVTLPGRISVRTDEIAPLDAWLRRGNTLLVLAALADRPDWALGSGGVNSDLNAITGLEFESVLGRRQRLRPPLPPIDPDKEAQEIADKDSDSNFDPDDSDAMEDAVDDVIADTRQVLSEPAVRPAVPTAPHPWFEGVARIESLSDYRATDWVLRMPYDVMVLAHAREPNSREAVFWSRNLGAGRILVSAYGGLLTNRVLTRADNARFLSNVVRSSVSRGGQVLIDDLHQGVSNLYDPEKFFKDPRLHRTLWILLALWFIWVLGATRLRTPQANITAPREADLVTAAGNFYARLLKPAAGARHMFEYFFAHLRRRLQLPRDAAPPWQWLDERSGLAAEDLTRLRAWYAAAYTEQNVPLRDLQKLLVKLTRQTS
jgi:hypothetical protein